MKALFLRAYVTLKLVPLALRLVVIFCLTGSVFAIVPFMPFVHFTIDDKAVTQSQFLRSGAGAGIILLGALMGAVAIAILLRKAWARPAILFLLPFACFLHAALGLSDWCSLGPYFLWSIVYIAPMAGYLYYKSSVRDYFNQSENARITAQIR
jgi:hypothetical protein